MDAFAVAVGKGLSMRKMNLGQAALIAAFFGGFQAFMPALGWLLGAQFEHYVRAVEGWIAFALLAFIGSKMVWDALHDDEGKKSSGRGEDARIGDKTDNSDGNDAVKSRLDLRELVMLAIATSIDAFAAGVAFALLDVNIVFAALFIGSITFALSFAGVAIGHQFGSRWERPSTIAGGAVLIAIGAKTLLESLGIL